MVLTVLKVIGMILLVILAIIIFIISVVCLTPIKYMVDGEYENTLNAKIKVTWFPMMLKVCLDVADNKSFYTIQLLGGVIKTNTDAKISWLGRLIFKEEKTSTDAKPPDEGKQNEVTKQEQQTKSLDKQVSTKKETKQTTVDDKTHKEKKPKKKFLDVKAKWQEWKEKIQKIKDKKDQLVKVYHSKRFEIAKKDVISYIARLWKVIKPYEGEGYIHFGLNDPATTGEIIGVLAMAIPLYDSFLTIRPDFEQPCFDGIVKAKGKIRMGSIFKIVLKVIFNKNLIKVVKKVQNIIEA